MPDFYKKNIAVLKRNHHDIWNIISDLPPDPKLSVVFSEANKLNLEIESSNGQKLLLHDPNNPEAEIPIFLDMIPEDFTGTIALLGVGLGYTPLALLKERPLVRHFILFETNPAIFKQALHCKDLTPLLGERRVILSIDPTPDIRKILKPAELTLQLEETHILRHVPSIAVNNDAYHRIYKNVFAHVNLMNKAIGAMTRFAEEFLLNSFANLRSIHHNLLLDDLAGKFENIPAILVGAGPSLDRDIHLITKAKGKAVIISVDSALPALLAKGVTPDFITSIDPQDICYEKIGHVSSSAKDTSLICQPSVTPRIPKIFPAKNIIWGFADNHLEKWMNNSVGGEKLIEGAGTVAHLNLLAANAFGCSPIIFVGQDLAFTGSHGHVQQTVLTSDQHQYEGAPSSANSSNLDVEGINGEKLTTTRTFWGMKLVFEQIISSQPNKYINSTSHGLDIRGTEVLPLSKVLDTYCNQSYNFSQITPTPPSGSIKPIAEILESIHQLNIKVKSLVENLKESLPLVNKCKDALYTLMNERSVYQELHDLPETLRLQLSSLEEYYRQQDQEEWIWKILENLTVDHLRQSERIAHEMTNLKADEKNYLPRLEKYIARIAWLIKGRFYAIGLLQKEVSNLLQHLTQEKNLLDGSYPYTKQQNLLQELTKLYIQSGEYILAYPVAKQIVKEFPGSAEGPFSLGLISLHQGNYVKAEKYFENAVNLSPEISKKIERCRNRIAEHYLNFAERPNFDRFTSLRMLIKGLRVSHNHRQIQDEIIKMATEDLREIESSILTSSPLEKFESIRVWHKALQEFPPLSSLLPDEHLSLFYRFHGIALIRQDDVNGAINSFIKAIELAPESPDLHICLADGYFALNEPKKAIQHLQTAVQLDRKYAEYWENIGDNLFTAGSYGDAIAAYQQCIDALPEKVIILKKIGNCYQEIGQGDKAKQLHEKYSQAISCQ